MTRDRLRASSKRLVGHDGIRAAAFLLLAALGFACRPPLSRELRNDAAVAADAASPAAEGVACGQEPGCHLRSTRSAGPPDRAPALRLAMVTLPARPFTPGFECTPTDTWLLAGEGAALRRVQLLVEECVVDPAAPPTFEVTAPFRVRYVAASPLLASDAARPPERVVHELALDPPRLLRTTHEATYADGVSERSWDYESLSGGACARAAPGQPCTTVWTAVPMVSTVGDGGFSREGWKHTALDGCAALLDGSPGHGLAQPARALAGTAVRALIESDAVDLEVDDGAFVTRGSVVDRLDLELSTYGAKPGEILAWHLFMDGRLESIGAGPAAPPRAQMVEVSPTTRRFRLAGAGAAWRRLVRLTYVDTDDGKSERGRLMSGSVEGEVHQVTADEATCAAEGGALHVHRTAGAITPLQPLVR